ncbi:hypothetical protein L1987_63448 [Smallanthus sonchifolius]|uniref:Uncharacterized protein n=1 Tax=Smallanthus sonchifolius TaxID=185202 RepID=A0ACB9CDB0_9ASTR|nr:hypothetical protein L1987_63448 [Smallanthus sonchifolius]
MGKCFEGPGVIMEHIGWHPSRRKESIAPTSFLCSCYVDDACFLFAESAIQNSEKSSALTDTIRIIQDLKAQVDMLKKEFSVLLADM